MVTQLDHTLTALADPTRRRVVDQLRRSPRRAGELARSCEMSPPAMSRHLRVLRRRGLIEETSIEEDARVRVYRLRPAPFVELRSWLDQVALFWTDQLESFRDFAESLPPEADPDPQP